MTADGIEFTSKDYIRHYGNDSLIPVDILRTTRSTITVSHHPFPLPQPPTPTSLSLSDHLLHYLPPWKSDLLLHLHCPTPSDVLLNTLDNTSDLSDHSILAACDGSFNTMSTFGWTLRNGIDDLATCYGPVHGHQANSYRAKATGLLSLLVFLHSVQSYFNSFSAVRIPIYIDNSALCKRIHRHTHRLYYSPSEALFRCLDVHCLFMMQPLLRKHPP